MTFVVTIDVFIERATRVRSEEKVVIQICMEKS